MVGLATTVVSGGEALGGHASLREMGVLLVCGRDAWWLFATGEAMTQRAFAGVGVRNPDGFGLSSLSTASEMTKSGVGCVRFWRLKGLENLAQRSRIAEEICLGPVESGGSRVMNETGATVTEQQVETLYSASSGP
jgi:hypothetical protein